MAEEIVDLCLELTWRSRLSVVVLFRCCCWLRYLGRVLPLVYEDSTYLILVWIGDLLVYLFRIVDLLDQVRTL